MKLFISVLHRLREAPLFQWIVFAALGLIAFHKIFSFWFYQGWETSWLDGLINDFSFINLMQSHGLVSYINYLLFGWRPEGWFAMALAFHIVTAMTVNYFVSAKINKTVGLVTGLLFLISTAHHDVVTWGTFESLYAAQTVCIYLGLWFFDHYRRTKRIFWYAAMIGVFLLSLVIRESGLLFIPIVFLFDLCIHEKALAGGMSTWRSRVWPLLVRHGGLWVFGVGFLALRALYGGAPNDFIDERIQFRILLMNEHRYLEYFIRSLLSFGYFIGPYVVPYPILNGLYELVVHSIPTDAVRVYFFSSFGWGTYVFFWLVAWLFRKKFYASYIWFSLFSITAVTGFYAFAWTAKDSFLATEYWWSENRWRYLGFTFFASAVSIVLYRLLKRKRSWAITLLGFYLVVNMGFLYAIQSEMYQKNSKPAKVFYKTFLKAFPTLSPDDRFYQYHGSSGLTDFFSELAKTAKTYYPALGRVAPHWARPDLYYILQPMKNSESWTKNVHFVDYNTTDGVHDHTREVNALFSTLHPQDLSFTSATDSVQAIVNENIHPTDFRYTVSVDYQLLPKRTSLVLPVGKQKALEAFSARLAELIDQKNVHVCKTAGDPEEPIVDLMGKKVLDGTINKRSEWWSDCRPAWLVVDMGDVVTFSGALWASMSHEDSLPRNYRYDVSVDGTTWETIQTRLQNTSKSRIDVFDRPVQGRYIRFWVSETSYRQLLRVNEFIPLFPDTVGVAGFYTDAELLYRDMHRYTEVHPWLTIAWTTNADSESFMEDKTVYAPAFSDGSWHTGSLELMESDYYGGPNDFLRRTLSHIRITPGDAVTLRVNRLTVSSPFAH